MTAMPQLADSIESVRQIQVGRALATAWLALWTAVGWVLGSVVFAIHTVIWAVGFTLGWSFHAANYGFRKGAHIKTEPRRRPSVPQ